MTAQVYIYNLRNLYKKKVLTFPEMTSKEIVSISFSADDTVLLCQVGAPDWLLSCWLWEKGKVRLGNTRRVGVARLGKTRATVCLCLLPSF